MKHQLSIIMLFTGCLLTNCSGQKKLSPQIPSDEINPLTQVDISKASNDSTVTDIDGNVYPVVVIEDKLWMAANLKVSKYNTGTSILPYSGGGFLKSEEKGMFVLFENDKANGEKYGKLYNHYAVQEGCLCPDGWHVPSEAEWQQVIDLQGVAKLNLLPGGAMNPGELSPFYGMGTAGYWWTSTSVGRNTAAYFNIQHEPQEVKRNGANEGNFLSVRCVKNLD